MIEKTSNFHSKARSLLEEGGGRAGSSQLLAPVVLKLQRAAESQRRLVQNCGAPPSEFLIQQVCGRSQELVLGQVLGNVAAAVGQGTTL